MSCVAALIPATDVGYDGVRLLDLDFERRNERILAFLWRNKVVSIGQQHTR
jgi:hypothetical protein